MRSYRQELRFKSLAVNFRPEFHSHLADSDACQAPFADAAEAHR
jgi:hypothetical protein